MSSTDPDETGFWGVISDCLDLSHTNDREGFEKVLAKIFVNLAEPGTGSGDFLTAIRSPGSKSQCILYCESKCPKDRRIAINVGNQKKFYVKTFLFKLFREQDYIYAGNPITNVEGCLSDLCINPTHLVTKGRPKPHSQRSGGRVKEQWLTPGKETQKSPSAAYKKTLKWVNKDGTTFKKMANLTPVKEHTDILLGGLRSSLGTGLQNMLVHCGDNTLFTNRFLMANVFPCLQTVQEQGLDYEIILPDHSCDEVTEMIAAFLENLSSYQKPLRAASRSKDYIVEPSRELYVPIENDDGLQGYLSEAEMGQPSVVEDDSTIIPETPTPEVSKPPPTCPSPTASASQPPISASHQTPRKSGSSNRMFFRRTCNDCAKDFTSLIRYTNHECVRIGAPNSCRICKFEFDVEVALIGHYSKNTDNCIAALKEMFDFNQYLQATGPNLVKIANPLPPCDSSNNTPVIPSHSGDPECSVNNQQVLPSVNPLPSSNHSSTHEEEPHTFQANARFIRKCSECSTYFTSLTKYAHHKCLYSGPPNCCRYCSKTFNCQVMQQHFAGSKECMRQLRQFADQSNSIDKERFIKYCPECTNRFQSVVKYAHHKCMYAGKPNTCRYCSKLLTSQHMQKSKECWKQCVLQFPEAQKNVPENRKPERENIAQKRSYSKRCDKCSIVFTTRSSFAHHECEYSGEQNSCKYCKAKFSDAKGRARHFNPNNQSSCNQSLREDYPHQEASSRKKVERFPCDKCKLVFRSMPSFYHHECMNDGDQSVCRYCNGVFLVSMRSHVLSNSDCRNAMIQRHLEYKKGKDILSIIKQATQSKDKISPPSETEAANMEKAVKLRHPKITLIDIHKVDPIIIQEEHKRIKAKRRGSVSSTENEQKKLKPADSGRAFVKDPVVVDHPTVMTTDDAYEIEYDNGEDDDQQIYGEELLEDEAQMLQIDKVAGDLTSSVNCLSEGEYVQMTEDEEIEDKTAESTQDHLVPRISLDTPGTQPKPVDTANKRNRRRHGTPGNADGGLEWMQCTECDKFFSENDFPTHKCKGKHYCEECDRQFTSSTSLTKHNQVVHPQHEKVEEAAPAPDSDDDIQEVFHKFVCQKCDDREFPSLQLLQMHQQLCIHKSLALGRNEKSLVSYPTIPIPGPSKPLSLHPGILKTETPSKLPDDTKIPKFDKPAFFLSVKKESELVATPIKQEAQSDSSLLGGLYDGLSVPVNDTVPATVHNMIPATSAIVPSLSTSVPVLTPADIKPDPVQETIEPAMVVDGKVSFDFIKVPNIFGFKKIKHLFAANQVEFSGVEKLDSTNKNLMHYDLRLKVSESDAHKMIEKDIRPGNSIRTLTNIQALKK